MNHRILLYVSFLAVLALSACSQAMPTPSAATEAPRPIAVEPRKATAIAYPTSAPEKVIPPTYAAPTIAAAAPNNGLDNYFQDSGVNPWTRTDRDNLSTFALDVDTASYDITKTYINDGALPPMDAVRAEEFINAFDQGYAAPLDAAFTLYADGGPSPFIESGNVLIRFGVQGYRVPDSERKPLNLTFVVDSSGSMAEQDRLGLVQESLHLLVDNLDERDMVTIVAYSEDAWLVLNPTSAIEKRVIHRAIDQLHPMNTTNVDSGLRLAYRHAFRNLNPEAVNRVILCSDGVANVGNIDPDTILSFVQGYVDSGITLTGIGVGMGNYNDVLLEKLADKGDGNYYYVDSRDQAREIFVENLTSTTQVIAYDAKIQIDFNREVVASYRLIGYENRAVADQDFRDDTVDAGEIGAGMSATALYEVRLQPGAEGRIATAQLRWQDADTREVIEIDGGFYTYDLAPSFEATSAYFQLTADVAAFAEILRASPYVKGNLWEVANEAQRIERLMVENRQAVEFAELAYKTASIARHR